MPIASLSQNPLAPANLRLPPFPMWQKQAEFFYSPLRRTGLLAGQGTGKSLLGASKGLTCVLFGAPRLAGGKLRFEPITDDPRAEGLVVMASYRELEDNAVPTFQSLIPVDLYRGFNGQQMRMHLVGLDGKSRRIVFRTATRPEDFHPIIPIFVFVDEAQRIPGNSAELLMGRLLRKMANAPFFATSTPEALVSLGDPWFEDFCAQGGALDDRIDEALPDTRVWKIKYEECDGTVDPTVAYLSQDNRLYAKRILSPERYAELYDADFTYCKGRIYGELREDIHRVPYFDIPPWWIRVAGVDFADTEPFCVVWAAVSPDPEPIWVIYREYLGHVGSATVEGQLIRDLSGDERVLMYLCDSASPLRIELLTQIGLPAVGAKKGPGSKLAGIDRVRGLIHPSTARQRPDWLPKEYKSKAIPRILFMDTCPLTWAAHKRWVWKQEPTTSGFRPVPSDRGDHPCDTVIYTTSDESGIMSEMPKEPVTGGNRVFKQLMEKMETHWATRTGWPNYD